MRAQVRPDEEGRRIVRKRVVAVAITAAAIAVVALGIRVFVDQGPGMAWFYAVAVAAILILFLGYPIAASAGHEKQGALAVFLALWFGPLSLLIVGPWLIGLRSRMESDADR